MKEYGGLLNDQTNISSRNQHHLTNKIREQKK
jgi:hypothetical protein